MPEPAAVPSRGMGEKGVSRTDVPLDPLPAASTEPSSPSRAAAETVCQ